jgi:hypothetical protein
MLFQTTAIQLIHCEIISGSPCSKAKDELPSFIPHTEGLIVQPSSAG